MKTLKDSCNLIFEIHWYPPYAMYPDEGKFEEEHFTYILSKVSIKTVKFMPLKITVYTAVILRTT